MRAARTTQGRRPAGFLSTLAALLCLTAGAADARGPWCDDLPLSLQAKLYDVGCDAAAPARLAYLWANVPRDKQIDARLLRVPAGVPQLAADGLPLPHVSLDQDRGTGLVERSWQHGLLRFGVLAGVSAVVVLATEAPKTARWTSTSELDVDTRKGLRSRSRSGRRAAAISSDVLLAGLGVALAADWYVERDVYPALRSVYVDSSWLVLNELANWTSKASAGRQRPYVGACAIDPDYIESCNSGRSDNASFYSGHASWGASLAGLICARRQAHEQPDEVGIQWGDVAWCGLSVTASIATGLLRIVADRHHLSDVGAGWTAGFLTGFVLPRVFDYRSADGGAFSRFQLAPMQHAGAWGLTASIEF